MDCSEYCCPVCNADDGKVFLTRLRDRFYEISGEWELVECEKCGIIYTVPPLDETKITFYYPPTYSSWSKSSEVYSKSFGQMLRWLAISPYILRYSSTGYEPLPFGKGTLLEIGCGSGGYLRKMAGLGWTCLGVDVNEDAIRQAMHSGLDDVKVVKGSLEDVPQTARFDLIVMNHVLEHLHNPGHVISRCFDLLNPGGALFISVPNIDSVEAKVFGRFWKGLDIPRHLVHFKESVLKKLVEEAGFSIDSIRPAMFASSISESLIMMLPSTLRRWVLNSSFSRLLYFSVVFPAALSYLLGNRGIIDVVASKPGQY